MDEGIYFARGTIIAARETSGNTIDAITRWLRRHINCNIIRQPHNMGT